jgi:NADH-quinone oxidoreductase subunit H
MDQLMNFAWKFMLPLALINIGIAGLWHFMPRGPERWLIAAALAIGSYVVLGRALISKGQWAKRTYRYAE